MFAAQGGIGRAARRGETPGRGVHEGAEGTGGQEAQAVLGTTSRGDDQRGELEKACDVHSDATFDWEEKLHWIPLLALVFEVV